MRSVDDDWRRPRVSLPASRASRSPRKGYPTLNQVQEVLSMPVDPNPSQTPPDAALMQIIVGKCLAMALSVVAKLRIADLLADGPKSLADLAARTETHAPSLYRVMRAMASVGVFDEQADGRYALTPTGEYLRTGVKGSLRG